MENKITYQKLRKSSGDKYVLAQSYYSILSVLNGLKLTEREVQLVAYTAIQGNITFVNVRDDFCNRYKTSYATINNIISRMKKLGVMVKEDGKVKVNPSITFDFDKDIILQISLKHEA